MKLTRKKTFLSSVLVLMPLSVFANNAIPTQEIQEARSVVKAFGGDLKSVLTSAMKTQGPIKALEVCNLDAGPIAKQHSALSDWNIGRTSIKNRNAKNAPDQWESSVLLAFEKRKLAGEALDTMEYSETIQNGDETVYRYMKAIPTAGPCLVCHGENIDENVANKIKSLYPDDKATGFTFGDIRGAFTLEKRSR
ncbi:Tll0287-like domain-containing protein [Thalassotalea profundi]|uniref:Tll0287-like domain-containing protein n=1 Tax=Thalassotalea profundi TaxID=2036687 RepID=A0ABQ3IFB2_9GAMM|nr:DUF3365 domain-containing protein [Thalassotalea profundi]GHE77902.1 hypothetical protein GCM10011501_01960 [Thalassotalea profundi]